MSDMPPNDNLINPNEFTETELVKLIYRDLHKLRQDFDEFTKNDTVNKEINDLKSKVYALEAEMKIHKGIQLQKEKDAKKMIAWIGVLLTIINLAGSFILKKLGF